MLPWFFRRAILCLAVLCCAVPASAQSLFTVVIPLEPGRQVRVYLPDGTVRQVGEVRSVPYRSLWPGFDASKWARPGCVAATGANAIHLLLTVERGRGRIISLIPTFTIAPASRPASAVVVDSVGGQSLWGAWAPTVGTPVTAIDKSGARQPLSEESLKQAVALEYTVHPRADCPLSVEFENRLEGAVTVHWPGRSLQVAKVVHPFSGIGFFEGSQFQGVGRIRANHPGVVCISTAPPGERGGFQILPERHAKSPEMKAAWYEPEWLIIAPVAPEYSEPGREPLFSGFLVPGPQERDEAGQIFDRIVRTPSVDVRLEGGEWQPLPSVTKNGPDSPLKRVTHLRVNFPFPLVPLTPDPSPTPVPTLGAKPSPAAKPSPGVHPSPGAAKASPDLKPTPSAQPKPQPTPKPQPKPTPRPKPSPHPEGPAYDPGAPEPEYLLPEGA